MAKLVSLDDFFHIFGSHRDHDHLFINDLINKFGIYQREQVNQVVAVKSNDEKMWIDSNIIKYSQFPSFVRYEWLMENDTMLVVYACGGKIIKMFPDKSHHQSKL